MKRLAFLALGTFLLAACAPEPIYNVNAHPIVTNQPLSTAEIERLIVEAGQGRGWVFSKVGPGKLRAVQNHPKYSAEVEISFDNRSYSITRVATRGMKEADGNIHPHYNFWVRNLENDIHVRLANAGFTQR